MKTICKSCDPVEVDNSYRKLPANLCLPCELPIEEKRAYETRTIISPCVSNMITNMFNNKFCSLPPVGCTNASSN